MANKGKMKMALAQTNGRVGSIGAAWPPRFDHHNNRVKGFYPGLVQNRGELGLVFEAVREAEAQNPRSTRTTVRAFVNQGLVETIQREPIDEGHAIEAVVPAGSAVPGHSMVYFGRNAATRVLDSETLRAEMQCVERIQGLHVVSIEQAARRVRYAGYTLDSVDGNGKRESDVETLFALYREAYEQYTFEITPGAISDMLNNGNIVIVGRGKEGEVVSSLIAEHCAIGLERGPIVHLYELSDYATFRAHRGNGLITAMQIDAVRTIRHLHPNGNAVVYAEDRAPWEAVNISSKKAGLAYCGTLMQHCVLVSDRSFGEKGVYENLNVWAALH